MTSIYLLFGSNLGNRIDNIYQSIETLVENEMKLLQVSHFYETEAWGIENQPSFYNVCAKFSSTLSVEKILQLNKKVEHKIGRIKRGRWEEREIDIDILYYGNEVITSVELTIPHLQLIKRRFALLPLHEINSEKKHPILKLTTQELLTLCTDEKEVKKLNFKPNF